MAETWLRAATAELVPLIDLIALILIAVGTLEAVVQTAIVVLSFRDNARQRHAVWMRYSAWLVGGLTFQLAADIIETSVTPDWDDIARIAAIAVIRTFLNFFLERDRVEIGDGSGAPAEVQTTSQVPSN